MCVCVSVHMHTCILITNDVCCVCETGDVASASGSQLSSIAVVKRASIYRHTHSLSDYRGLHGAMRLPDRHTDCVHSQLSVVVKVTAQPASHQHASDDIIRRVFRGVVKGYRENPAADSQQRC